MELAYGNQALEHIRRVERVRLMEHSLVTGTRSAGLVGIDARDDEDAVLHLFLHLAEPGNIVNDGIAPVRRTGTDDEQQSVIPPLEDVGNLAVVFLFGQSPFFRNGVHLLHFLRDKEFPLENHIHRALFVKIRPPLGGKAHHLLHFLTVFLLKCVAQLLEFACKQVHLLEQLCFVFKKQFRPHIFVDAGNAGEVAEGVSGVIDHMMGFLAVHQCHCNAVGKLREETYHLVVLLWAEAGYLTEPEVPGNGFDSAYCLLAVALGWGEYEIRPLEDIGIAVLDSIHLAPRHRVGRNELQVWTEHPLNLGNYPAFHSGDIGKDGTAAKPLLVLAYPLPEDVRVERKDHHIPSSQVIGVQSGGAGRYYAFLQGVVDGGSAAGDSSHFEAGTGQPFSV